ncbi:MAG TPA: alternative ribosome rescue aminoacyl-tRNA hydrolase ArfB [Planctomycetota bacterium]|nr:alternative ribosome rescue aminoacyl-tRNA hydrolase ArfB [Planctomycetota bacterium]
MIRVPRDQVRVAFSRSGGPGGQNVNKTATKAEVRFTLDDAAWLSPEQRARVREKLAHRITRDGELIVASERERSQKDNLEDCFAKLESLLTEALRRERPRRPTKPTKASKTRRLDAKKARGDVKRGRRARFD